MPLLNSDGTLFEPPPVRRPTYTCPTAGAGEELAEAFYRRYLDGLVEWERWRQARREQQEQGETEREP